MTSLLFILAVIPVIVICTYIYKKDKNKEPWSLLIKLFLLGIASCILVLILSGIMFAIFPFMEKETTAMTIYQVMMYSFIGVALIEEFSKWIMVRGLAYHNAAYDEVYDGIVYAVYVSLGFAFIENLLYVLGNNSITIGITRGILAVPGHACDAVFMGYYLSMAKAYSKQGNLNQEKKNLVLSIIAPTLLHGFYDFCLFSGSGYLLIAFFIFVITLWIFSIKKIKKLANISAKNSSPKATTMPAGQSTYSGLQYQGFEPGPSIIAQQPQAPFMPASNQNQNLETPKFCYNCGAPITGNFCSRCGAKQTRD